MRLVMDGRARRLLRRLPAVNIYSGAELLLLAALAFQSARLIWAVVTPVDPLGDWRPAAPVIAGVPADALASFDPFFRLSGGDSGPAVVTSVQLTLFGTRIDEAQGGGSAIVAGPDGVQRSVAVGEELAPGVRLKAVAFDHITLDRGGAAEDLFLDQSRGGQAVAVPAVTPPSAPGAPPPATGIPVAQIRQEIGFIPRIDSGRVSGLVVRPQGTGAVFRQAGLREGDVVTAIAARPVQGADDLDRIASDFRGGGTIPITVERGTQTLQLAITVAPAR